MRRVVVTGLGVVAPNGIGKEAFWSACLAGRERRPAHRVVRRLGPPCPGRGRGARLRHRPVRHRAAPPEPEDHGPRLPLRRGGGGPRRRGQRPRPLARGSRAARRRHGHGHGADGPARDRPAAARRLRRGGRPAHRPLRQGQGRLAVPAVDLEVPAEHGRPPTSRSSTGPRGRTARSRRPAPPARRPSARRSASSRGATPT